MGFRRGRLSNIIKTHDRCSSMGPNILLTGWPGVGKTTILKRVLSLLKREAGGFYTEEIRTDHRRVGFKIVTLEGREGVLAHVDYESKWRVGRYGVDLGNLEEIAVPAILEGIEEELVIIDEIGKMELFSSEFREAVIQALDSPTPVLGAIMLKPHPFADGVKGRPDVQIFVVTRDNRDTLVDKLVDGVCR